MTMRQPSKKINMAKYKLKAEQQGPLKRQRLDQVGTQEDYPFPDNQLHPQGADL